MSEFDLQKFYSVFRTSNSSEELFDAFREAIKQNINDADLYKTLLWNKALSTDEIIMYSEKICNVFPQIAYDIYLFVGRLLESNSIYCSDYNNAFNFYLKAFSLKKSSAEPLLLIADLYNSDLNIPKFETIIHTLEDGLNSVKEKSKICLAMAKLYKEKGNTVKEREYNLKASKYLKEGN